jgi:prepilin-type N-terminal cleavage/methylation domain-containing protein
MRSKQRGMTLLEIMIVLAIIALVMGLLVGPKLIGHYRTSQRRIATMAVHRFADEDYPMWAINHPSQPCPATFVELSGPRTTTTDPWGTPYQLHCGATAPPVPNLAFGASSFGEDQRAATPDDITSWR